MALCICMWHNGFVVGARGLNSKPKGNKMQNIKLVIKLVKGANHAPRTGYNVAMWAAVNNCKGIATGVPMATLHSHLLAQVPTQSVGHCTAHIKYLVRQKGALALVAA